MVTELDRMESAFGGEWTPTVCARCAHLYIVNAKDGYWRWLCLKQPRAAWFNRVTGETKADPPYARCVDLNDGNCPEYSEGVNSLSPDKLKPMNLKGEARRKEESE